MVVAHTSDYRSGSGEMVEDQQVEDLMLVVLTETVKEEEPHVEVELIEREVWSYGGAVVVDQKTEGGGGGANGRSGACGGGYESCGDERSGRRSLTHGESCGGG
ncbi:hypothetical protein DY000_02000344 [Brassica cretica]|uniref:Uncharacterized protein n=1 Tax=Brassica cretica TaxID=69181 RepID=A0ABQ7CHD3_BRACR|nr:hypothetical protein DY000_02000344 [Brassica cretica]